MRPRLAGQPQRKSPADGKTQLLKPLEKIFAFLQRFGLEIQFNEKPLLMQDVCRLKNVADQKNESPR
jgi:hypothetical protein